MSFYHVDGLRLDSVNNYKNWEFAGEIRDTTRQAWNDRWQGEGNPATGGSGGADERFLVIGEELSVPKELLGKLDALWNETFKQILRKVILGKNADGEASFEWSVRKLIDCRNLGFTHGYQAINYIGSHDVGGMGNERFYNYLHNNGVALKEKPIKLAFVCLLTAVGIPMILAGDEFGEQSNFEQVNDSNKEIDPINFEHLQDAWRKDVFQYVSRLVKFRTTSNAFSVDDADFIHVDFADGKRVLAWKRGRSGVDDPVIAVANFSDWGTIDPNNPNALYDISNFPAAPQGRTWREITQNRPAPRAGNEPLFPWEGKVYALN
jgi:1,4-alpha-glucan branching enzyme